MRRIVLLVGTVAIAGLHGCTSVNWEVEVERTETCGQQGCTDETVTRGTVGGTWGGEDQPEYVEPNPLLQGIDANLLSFHLDGSSVSVPQSGSITVHARNASGGLVASQTFGWSRSGNVITPSDPNAVNSWAAVNAQGAASADFELYSGPLSTEEGYNTFLISVQYDGSLVASDGEMWINECEQGQPYVVIC
ncbi:hypothetical protein [Hyphobacterium marinum]|uniref:Ig-like domain-containing protein n=1 Tax=Hyphobacterium marinum TaxID=3116574 RepID=A0ABU7M185_9PROT|nr:hypothetical protein [Hyphobacterium sp. Y6023]MEE2567577.1 hypothetical protein [Hyphobacterium sp. Y6023]